MHDRISVHSICFSAADMEGLVANWRALGARRVSFSSAQLLGADPVGLIDMLQAGCHCVETVTHIFRSGPLARHGAEMQTDQARLMQAITVAKSIGAKSIYMLTGGRGEMDWEEAAEVFAGAIAPCRVAAADAGVALAVENTSPFYAHAHLANTLRDTLTLAAIANIGVCIDFFACWTEAGLHGQIMSAMKRLQLVQVGDYVLGDRALPCRAVPGDGAIPWSRIIGWLLDAGYAGVFDLELIGPRIDREGQTQAVRRAAKAIGGMLAARGV